MTAGEYLCPESIEYVIFVIFFSWSQLKEKFGKIASFNLCSSDSMESLPIW